MKKTFLFFFIIILVSGCKSKPDIPTAECLVFTTLNNHKVTTWVNDEPVLVCDNVWNGYNKAFWLTLRKGINKVYFTAERLPDEITKVIDEYTPDTPNDGSTIVKIIKGDIFTSEDMIVWKATSDFHTSPVWSINSDIAWRPSLKPYDTIRKVDRETESQLREFLKTLKKSLESKKMAGIGFNESDFEFLSKELGLQCSVQNDIFNVEYYEVTVSPIEELKIVKGKKTIMLYRPDGEPVFYAGISRSAPRENEKMYYHFSGDALYFVKSKGKLEPLWVKKY